MTDLTNRAKQWKGDIEREEEEKKGKKHMTKKVGSKRKEKWGDGWVYRMKNFFFMTTLK